MAAVLPRICANVLGACNRSDGLPLHGYYLRNDSDPDVRPDGCLPGLIVTVRRDA